MADRTDIATRSNRPLSRREPAFGGPFHMLERFADEMDRMFDEFGLGRGWDRLSHFGEATTWTPRIDVTQQNNELIVRADLPGLNKADVKVDVTDDTVVIQGERHQEHHEDRGGIYRRERSYGSFYRAVPLPDGAIADQAKATFKNGVLEVRMPAPPEQVTRGRRLEIAEGSKEK